jgi:hypothetical protein
MNDFLLLFYSFKKKIIHVLHDDNRNRWNNTRVILFITPNEQFSAISPQEQVTFDEMIMKPAMY